VLAILQHIAPGEAGTTGGLAVGGTAVGTTAGTEVTEAGTGDGGGGEGTGLGEGTGTGAGTIGTPDATVFDMVPPPGALPVNVAGCKRIIAS